jgi:branched-chain amino acid transport system ATP-binding protein
MGQAMPAPVLGVEGVSVHYGGVRAVREVSFEVAAGQAVAILGANGAGKTSLLRAISGLVPHDGEVMVGGVATTGLRPEQIARLGLAHVPDNRGVFDDLTVRENLTTALYGVGGHGGPSAATAIDEVFDLFPILRERQQQPAGTMSGGQQQMLTIARALVQRPRVVMIDEMSMGLAPVIVAELFATIAQLTEQGIAVVLVEQFVDQALAVVDHALVLSGGTVVAAGKAADLAADDVAALYLGATPADQEHVHATLEEIPLPDSEPVDVRLNARELRALHALAAAQGRDPSQVAADALRQAIDLGRQETS